MKKIDMFKNKKVFVLGLAKSGYHVALLLQKLGAIIVVNDLKEPENLSDVQHLQNLGVTVITGSHPEDMLNASFDYMIKNPGIRYDNVMVQKALTLKIPVLTDVEIAYLVSSVPIISVTGTNGKTTTTTLIANMLETLPSGGSSQIAGNIGIPATKVVQQVGYKDVIVMEMSSFQLMGVSQFRPNIAVITNIYSAHLDYHGTRKDYVNAKLNMIRQQQETDYTILNGDLKESYELAKQTKAKVLYFSKVDKTAAAHIDGEDIVVFGEKILSLTDIRVPGIHNIENVLAATLVAVLYRQSRHKIVQAVQSFTGVKHRTQFVKTVNKRLFYNDSKATNILATQMALQGFDTPVILIAGGLDRKEDFTAIVPSLAKVKVLVVYGETKDAFALAGNRAGVKQVIQVASLQEAVSVAYERSVEDDVILFSPACASWDQFANFEVRGDTFIACVNAIEQSGNR